VSTKREGWSWIIGGLIIAAAMIAGAFITRGAEARPIPAITLHAQAFGVSASVDLVL